MSMSDKIADMLTRIRNGQAVGLLSVDVPLSRFKLSVLDVLKQEGYIQGYDISQAERMINVKLKYSESGEAAICEIHKVSKPGRRIYSAIKQLRNYYNGMGIFIISSSQGVVSDRYARQHNVGGEVICKVF